MTQNNENNDLTIMFAQHTHNTSAPFVSQHGDRRGVRGKQSNLCYVFVKVTHILL